jgi:hypothetical protein
VRPVFAKDDAVVLPGNVSASKRCCTTACRVSRVRMYLSTTWSGQRAESVSDECFNAESCPFAFWKLAD